MRDCESVGCRQLADPIGGSALVALLLHERFAVQLFGFELVVSAAAQSQVLHGAAAAEGYGTHVVIFEHRAFGTARALLAQERAALAIALGYASPDLSGNVARVAVCPARPRGVGVAELLLLQARYELPERALQHLRGVAARLCGSEQLLRTLQQVVRVLVQRDLEQEATG